MAIFAVMVKVPPVGFVIAPRNLVSMTDQDQYYMNQSYNYKRLGS